MYDVNENTKENYAVKGYKVAIYGLCSITLYLWKFSCFFNYATLTKIMR